MNKIYEIQYSEPVFDEGESFNWKSWAGSTDPAELLEEFVDAVSNEEIDDVNLYWRVQANEINDRTS